jgi:tetratricopeptide (TPR) repeat protein
MYSASKYVHPRAILFRLSAMCLNTEDEPADDMSFDPSHLERFLENPRIKESQLAEDLTIQAMIVHGFYQNTNDENCLELAIQLTQCSIDATPDSDLLVMGRRNNLAAMTFTLYLRNHRQEDLVEAIRVTKQITDSTSKEDPNWAGRMANLSTMLQYRYEATGDTEDLSNCIEIARDVLKATPSGDWEEFGRLSNLASQLRLLFKRTGNLVDIEEAIQLAQLAVEVAERDQADGTECLNNLGAILESRYNYTEEIQVLEHAIRVSRRAVDATPSDHIAKSRRIKNLSHQLLQLYKRSREQQVLEEAVQMARVGLSLTPPDHSERAGNLNALSVSLRQLSERTNNVELLNEGIQHLREAFGLTPTDEPDGSIHLNNLGVCLATKYAMTGDEASREEGVKFLDQSIRLTPLDHPDRATWLVNLGNIMELEYQTADGGFLRQATYPPEGVRTPLECYIESYQSINAHPVTRIHAAREALRILADREAWNEAVGMAESAVRLLHIVCRRYAVRADQQHAIAQSSGLAADTCSVLIRGGVPDKALQLLEFGRGLIFGYMIDDRNEPAELSKLKGARQELSQVYENLKVKATIQPATEDAVATQMSIARWEAIRDIETCIKDIRKLPGHERFLLEPAIEELTVQATNGPIVIINVTRIGAHAVIVTDKGADVIELPEMNRDSALERLGRDQKHYGTFKYAARDVTIEVTSNLDSDLLAWLWESCVKIVIDRLKDRQFLGDPDIGMRRVWWIGTGMASALPFHAAGLCETTSLDCTLMQMTPSYTPTIKSLAYSRSRAAAFSKGITKDCSALVVAMPASPGERPLPGAHEEARIIKEIISHNCRCETPQSPTAEVVLTKISESSIIHFACHAKSDPINPLDSYLLLEKKGPTGALVADELTLSRISDVVLSHDRSWLAFLAACSTAEVKATWLEDEGLHLAGSFQVAGFAHVIGSLWKADDKTCVELTLLFYKELVSQGIFTNKAVSSSLRSAVLRIRSENLSRPDIWAPFIHIGA